MLATATAARVEFIQDVASFAELRPEWNRLLASSRSDCLFLTWEWLFTWWQHLAGDRRLHLLAVRAAGRLIAIAPFARAPRFRFGHPLETLEFLGSGFVGSDYLDVIVEDGSEEIALAAFSDYLGNAGFALRWTNVGPGSFAASLAGRIGERQWSVSDRQINVCPYIPLSGLTWESYLAGLGASIATTFAVSGSASIVTFACAGNAGKPSRSRSPCTTADGGSGGRRTPFTNRTLSRSTASSRLLPRSSDGCGSTRSGWTISPRRRFTDSSIEANSTSISQVSTRRMQNIASVC